MFTLENSGRHKQSNKGDRKPIKENRDKWFFDPGLLLLTAWVVTAFLLVVLSLMFPPEAASKMLPKGESIKPSQVREGSLLFQDVNSGQYVPAPQLNTDVKIEITGMVVFARVIQVFENPGDEWLEGVYVFPLPEDAAVSHLTMDVGERVIEGVIKEKEEAKKTYTEAKKEGKKVSLLEQERPNIFMMSVANIGPHEVIKVELEYQQTVRFGNGVFSLRFPTVVSPRYISAQQTGNESSSDEFELSGWAFASTEVPDAPRITSPSVVEPGQDPDNLVSLEVILDPGFNLVNLQSLYHAVDVRYVNDEKAVIRLVNTWAVADQDFVLEWAPGKVSMPQAALFTENKSGEKFVYLMVMPPAENVVTGYHVPREVIFVVDVSGSMDGPSIRQAKEALLFAVPRLQPQDRFNLIIFNDAVDKLFNYPVTATNEHVEKALKYISGLRAGGGTEIESALYEALDGGKNLNRIRQVIFLTDGSVGNEQHLFQMTRERLGDSRLFTVGIGSAPNSYFMKNIAERGKGTFTYIGDVKEVKDRMEELYTKLENPLLTDIRLSFSNRVDTEMFPDPIPDLYLGEPVTLVARTGEVPEKFVLSGYFAGRFWETEINAKGAGESDGISILWARQKIKSLMDSLDGEADPEEVRKNVLATALRHHLVSKYTSLVAVDVTPSRPQHENVNSKMAKTNLPKGWQYNKVLDLPQTATVAELCFILGALALLLSLIIWVLVAREREISC